MHAEHAAQLERHFPLPPVGSRAMVPIVGSSAATGPAAKASDAAPATPVASKPRLVSGAWITRAMPFRIKLNVANSSQQAAQGSSVRGDRLREPRRFHRSADESPRLYERCARGRNLLENRLPTTWHPQTTTVSTCAVPLDRQTIRKLELQLTNFLPMTSLCSSRRHFRTMPYSRDGCSSRRALLVPLPWYRLDLPRSWMVGEQWKR